MKRVLALVMLAAAVTLPMQFARACGFCVEDKIAAVYDHAVVTKAIASKHHVAFFGLGGQLVGSAAEARNLERLAASIHGVDAGSVRVNVESASLSVAYDPAAVSFVNLQKYLQRKVTSRGLEVLPLRVMDRPAELKTAARP